MARHSHHAALRGALAVVGGLGGLVLAVIFVLNLHILVGLENGYAAGPREVWDSSALLAVADVALLVTGPLLGALAVRRLSAPPRVPAVPAEEVREHVEGDPTRDGPDGDRQRADRRPR